jgi:hypothetical protein
MPKPKLSDATCRELVGALSALDKARWDLENIAQEMDSAAADDEDDAAGDLSQTVADLASDVDDAFNRYNGNPDGKSRGAIQQALPKPWGR